MKYRVAIALVLTWLGSPAQLHACTCLFKDGQALPPPWIQRARIFVGHVLEVDETPTQSPRETVRFVAETSWRDPLPDTVTLLVGSDASCAHYQAGIRYLVAADKESAPGAPLRTAPCDYAWAINYSTTKSMLAQLGSPSWTAPPVGRRMLDAKAVRLGNPVGRLSQGDSLAFGLPVHDSIARFELGDWVGKPITNSRIVYLRAGLYQFRITWTDGTSYSSYVSLRCEQPIQGAPCAVFRSFAFLR
jgi:hypothetical protein